MKVIVFPPTNCMYSRFSATPGGVCLFMFVYFSLTFSGFSQNTYEKGYIVTSKHDTLQGLIDYKNWEFSPSEITFKTSTTSEEKVYKPDHLITFFIEKNQESYDAHYLTYIPINPDIVYSQGPHVRVEKNVLLQRLWSNGTVFLYAANIREGHKDRFWVKNDGIMTELIHYTFRRYYDGSVHEAHISEYGTQLKELTKDATGFSAKKPTYTAASLIRYFSSYNQAKGGVKEYKPIQEKHEWYIGLSGGIETFNLYENKIEVNPAFGATIRVNMPRNFHNSFIKASYHLTPGVDAWDYGNKEYINHTVKSLEISAGQYIGHSDIQPFWSIGLGMYKINYEGAGVFFPNAGVSYKKRIELEISRFIDLFFPFRTQEKRFLLPPRIALSYHIKL